MIINLFLFVKKSKVFINLFKKMTMGYIYNMRFLKYKLKLRNKGEMKKMNKRILTLGLALIMISSGIPALANRNIESKVAMMEEDHILDLSNVETYNKNGTKMVPIREVAENHLGLEIKWIAETRSVEIGSGPRWTSIKIGENSYFYGKIAPFKLSQAPEIKNSLTYVPIEFFTKVLSYKIKSEEDIVEESILTGFVKSVESKNRILVAGDEKNKGTDEVLFIIGEETIVVDKSGKDFNIEDLKVGSKVEVVLPEILTLSLPPQGVAVKITVMDTSVSIEDNIYENNADIQYPKILGLEDEIGKEINLKIEEFIENINRDDLYKDLKLDYEISLLSDEKLSILFNGRFNFGDSEKLMVKSLNLNLETAKEITYDNYFDTSKSAQEKLLKILEKSSKQQMDMDFEAEGKSIYFKGSNLVVFYYPLDDSVIHPVYLYIPLEDIKDLIK